MFEGSRSIVKPTWQQFLTRLLCQSSATLHGHDSLDVHRTRGLVVWEKETSEASRFVSERILFSNQIMSSQPDETPQVSEAEQRKLDLEAAVKEKQEQDGEFRRALISFIKLRETLHSPRLLRDGSDGRRGLV